jgi:hypothetical protein
MSGFEAEFMGGPLHGEVMVLPGESEPPTTVYIQMALLPVEIITKDAEDNKVELGTFIYHREVSALDVGPFWVYVPCKDQE